MSTAAWPDTLASVLTSDYMIQKSGLEGWWPGGNIPLYPDNLAGTTWIRNSNFTSADLATGTSYPSSGQYGFYNGDALAWDNTELSIVDGVLIITNTHTSNILRLLVDARSKHRRVYMWSSVSDSYIVFNNDGTYYARSITANTWTPFDILFDSSGDGFTDIEHLPIGTIKIAMDYIGTGVYDYLLPDCSGNTLTLLPKAILPTIVSSYYYNYFNGEDAYLRTNTTLAEIPDVQTFVLTFPSGNAVSSSPRYIINYKAESTTVGFFSIRRPTSGDYLYFRYCNGSAMVDASLGLVFTGYSSTKLTVQITINWSSSAITLSDGTVIAAYTIYAYRNGVYFSSASMSAPIKPLSGDYLYFSSHQGIVYYLLGTMGNILYFNKGLTLQERTFYGNSYTLYEALPSYPLQDGYSENLESTVLRTENEDSGLPQVRRRWYYSPTSKNETIVVNRTQKQILDQFYDTTLEGGTQAFTVTHPTEGTTDTMRFIGTPPSYSVRGINLSATLAVEKVG